MMMTYHSDKTIVATVGGMAMLSMALMFVAGRVFPPQAPDIVVHTRVVGIPAPAPRIVTVHECRLDQLENGIISIDRAAELFPQMQQRAKQ